MTTIHINNWIRFHSCSVSADQKSELGKIIRPPLMWEFFSSLPSRHSVRRIFWGQMTDNPLGHWNQWFFCVGGFLSDLKCEKNFGGLDNYQYQLRLKIPGRCSASSTTKYMYVHMYPWDVSHTWLNWSKICPLFFDCWYMSVRCND